MLFKAGIRMNLNQKNKKKQIQHPVASVPRCRTRDKPFYSRNQDWNESTDGTYTESIVKIQNIKLNKGIEMCLDKIARSQKSKTLM